MMSHSRQRRERGIEGAGSPRRGLLSAAGVVLLCVPALGGATGLLHDHDPPARYQPAAAQNSFGASQPTAGPPRCPTAADGHITALPLAGAPIASPARVSPPQPHPRATTLLATLIVCPAGN